MEARDESTGDTAASDRRELGRTTCRAATSEAKLVRERERQRQAERAAEEERRRRDDDERRQRWSLLSNQQQQAFRQTAIANAHPQARGWLEKKTIDNPAQGFLVEMDKHIDIAL